MSCHTFFGSIRRKDTPLSSLRFSHCSRNCGRRRWPCRDSGENPPAVAATLPLRRCGEIYRQRQCLSDAGAAKRAGGGASPGGVYVNVFLKNRPEIEEVACFLRTPSYISCEWALNRHGILLQSPVVCTVLTLSTAVGSARNVQYGGVTIEFSHLAPASSPVSRPGTASTWPFRRRPCSIRSTCARRFPFGTSWISLSWIDRAWIRWRTIFPGRPGSWSMN